jgi:hypothetical protein
MWRTRLRCDEIIDIADNAIVFLDVPDPVGAGFVTSLGLPRGVFAMTAREPYLCLT